MIKKTILLLLSVFFLQPVFSEVFRYKYEKGKLYRIISEVNEDVYLNNIHSHSARVLNKIAVEVKDTADEKGLLYGTFQTSEKSVGKYSTYSLSEEYESVFWRDEKGKYDIEDKYYMPVVRNVPLFPDMDLKPGDTWSGSGMEVHDFRRSFNIQKPYSFPINVSYQYLGKDETGNYDLISVKYNVFYKTDQYYSSALYPVRVSGRSDQLIKWDNKNGRPYSYFEEFSMIFDLSTGDYVEYTGRASAEIVESDALDRNKIKEKIESDLESSGINDVRVESVDKGVTLILEDIQFLPDSTVLAAGELEKIKKIGVILKNIPGRDIMITGHTALAGTEEGRKKLSVERAGAVAEYLLKLGAKEEKEIMIQGKGALEPVADNSTAEGMRRNRRVEITILEN